MNAQHGHHHHRRRQRHGSAISGDGGPATAADLNLSRRAWRWTLSGNLYIADDSGNDASAKVDTTGIITTLAGNGPTGTGGYYGDGVRATSAELNGPIGIWNFIPPPCPAPQAAFTSRITTTTASAW